MSDAPQDEAAEQSTLGAMLLSRDAITSVAETGVREDHFYKPAHGEIYAAITALAANGEPADAITVSRELEKRGWLKKIGGAPYLHTLISVTPTAAGASSYARVVHDKWRQRQIIAAGHRFIALGMTDATGSDDVDGLLAQADSVFRELGQPSRTGLMWDDLVEKWRNWQDKEGGAIPTPWIELNAWLHGGVHKGQLIIIGGRPGEGKSNGGLNIALEAAESGFRATVFSVEMDDVEVCSRLLAAGSWSKMGQIFSRRMDMETLGRVEEYIEARKGMQLEVVDQAYITVEQIVAHCRLRRPDVVFVDYAQLLQSKNTKVSREQQVAHITRSLKVAAKHLGMAVIVAAQLNRAPATGGREPMISDLRESGAAEQDADVVILLHRPTDHEKEIRLIVGKNRNGPTGIVSLTFRGELARVG